MTTYISFIGFLETPSESDLLTLNRVYPPNHKCRGFRENLQYKEIGGKDSLTIELAVIPGHAHIGHLVADCTPGGWVSDTFVMLDENGDPIKSPENFNPNPVEQII